jgi:hypothetical protein
MHESRTPTRCLEKRRHGHIRLFGGRVLKQEEENGCPGLLPDREAGVPQAGRTFMERLGKREVIAAASSARVSLDGRGER